jgi:energy-coupling factor transporter ATP-binding protein EcfA2
MSNKKSTDMFNWYETKAMKDLTKDDNYYDYSATDIKPNSRILCCGTTGSGKTQALLHYIRLSPNLFSRVIVFYKETEPIYELLHQGLKKRVEFHTDLAKLPKLSELRNDMEKDERILLVLDDYMMELSRFPNVNDYFIYGRKKNITLFCLAQSYYTVPKVVRQQVTYLLLFKITQKRDINLILSEYDNKDKELLSIYKSITNEPLQFLKICCFCSTGDDTKKISRNFTEYIEFII